MTTSDEIKLTEAEQSQLEAFATAWRSAIDRGHPLPGYFRLKAEAWHDDGRAKTLATLVGQDIAKSNAIKLLRAGRWLYITNSSKTKVEGESDERTPGCGKTHLAYGLLRERFKQLLEFNWEERPVLNVNKAAAISWTHSDDFYRSLTRTFGQPFNYADSEDEILTRYCRAPVLFFDDLGVGNMTEWKRDRVSVVLNERYQEKLQTIITSNLSLQQLAELIDDRITSRILERGGPVYLHPVDYRLLLHKEMLAQL